MEDEQSKIIYDNIKNFKSDEEVLVLNSIRQLGKISEALGTERTIKELLPFLRELLDQNSVIVSALLEGIAGLNLDLRRHNSLRQQRCLRWGDLFP